MKRFLINKLLIFNLLLLSVVSLSAQHNPKNRVSLSVGPAVPLGDIKKCSLDSSLLMNGFAKVGAHFNLTYTHNLSNNFGITAAFFGNVNPVNMDRYRAEYKQLIVNEIPLLEGVNFSHDNDKGNWTNGGLLIGPNINFYLAHHFYLEVRGLIGLGLCYSPEIHNTITFDTHDNKFTYTQQSAHTEAFAWNVGAGFNYRFDRLFIRLNVDYMSNKFKFNNLNIQYPTLSDDSSTEDFPLKMELTNEQLQISAGIGICF